MGIACRESVDGQTEGDCQAAIPGVVRESQNRIGGCFFADDGFGFAFAGQRQLPVMMVPAWQAG